MATSNAQVAFDVFYEQQSAMFGTSRPTKLYGQHRAWPYFLQLALICSARGWDPADYVKKAVGGARTTGCMMPQDLVRPGVLEAYNPGSNGVRNAGEEYDDCVRLLLAREFDPNGGNDEHSLLLSPMSAFPAWFRVWYPETIDVDIVNTWGEIAKREISSSRGLTELFEKLDPSKWEKLKKLLWAYAPVHEEGGAQ